MININFSDKGIKITQTLWQMILFKIHTRYLKKTFFFAVFIFSAALSLSQGLSRADEGIECYYLRYDIQSRKNKIKDEKLTMVPCQNEFRAENFSQLVISKRLSGQVGESTSMFKKRAKEQALKSILVKKGLKSVTVRNKDTIISHEGVIIVPVRLTIAAVHPPEKEDRLHSFTLTAQIRFAPLSFPDKWKQLEQKKKTEDIIQTFFRFFNEDFKL